MFSKNCKYYYRSYVFLTLHTVQDTIFCFNLPEGISRGRRGQGSWFVLVHQSDSEVNCNKIKYLSTIHGSLNKRQDIAIKRIYSTKNAT